MNLLGALESVIVTVTSDESLRGIRVRRNRKAVELCAYARVAADGRPFAERFHELSGALGRRNDHQLFFAPAIPSGVFFQTELPLMNRKEIPGALEFVVPQQLLAVPEAWRMQFVTRPVGENEEKIRVSAWVCAEAELQKLYHHFASVPCKPDEIIEPLIALPPELPPEAIIYFPEFQPDFCWRNGVFHAVSEFSQANANADLKAYLKNIYLFPEGADADDLLNTWLPGLTIGAFVESPRFAEVRDGLDLVPPEYRPQRLRTALRIGAVLLAVFLLLFGWNAVRSSSRYADDYRAVSKSLQNGRKRTADLQRRLKVRDKAYKEMSRALEQAEGGEKMIVALGMLTSSLPQQVLVSRFRAAENSLEITLQSSQEDLNLEPALRKMTGYKISNLQNRKLSDTLTLYNLRMEPVAKGERRKKK